MSNLNVLTVVDGDDQWLLEDLTGKEALNGKQKEKDTQNHWRDCAVESKTSLHRSQCISPDDACGMNRKAKNPKQSEFREPCEWMRMDWSIEVRNATKNTT
jgi:hypothetical protein